MEQVRYTSVRAGLSGWESREKHGQAQLELSLIQQKDGPWISGEGEGEDGLTSFLMK